MVRMQKADNGTLYLLRKSFKKLGDSDPLRLAGATAFFATFSLPAILLLILYIVRLILPTGEVNEELFSKLNRNIGQSAARQLFKILNGYEEMIKHPIAMFFGLLFLLFVSTTLFRVIKNSLNDIWDIEIKHDLPFGKILRVRLRELAIIVSAGLLFLLTLSLEWMHGLASEQLVQSSTVLRLVFNNAINFLISVIVVTCWFALIFCYLPDGRIPFVIGLKGAFVTSILFNLGKLLLRYLLLDSNLSVIFGRSASIALLLLFVFYSSLIFYFGAAFTKLLVSDRHEEVKPLNYRNE